MLYRLRLVLIVVVGMSLYNLWTGIEQRWTLFAAEQVLHPVPDRSPVPTKAEIDRAATARSRLGSVRDIWTRTGERELVIVICGAVCWLVLPLGRKKSAK
jgi:hypothetical protein